MSSLIISTTRSVTLFVVLSIFLMCKTNSQDTSANHEHTNALINESSPYLLQHAHNPVDWQPWGPEALEQAERENKLLIVSIGYAACHWCHVMEHESFEDSLVAEIMNEHFIPIKVDREERPDVDDVYMTACHLVSGGGGWPLNAFALPNGKPVWAGTYFPKEQWMNILEQFKNLKENDYAKLEDQAEKITAGIQVQDEIDLVLTEEEFTTDEVKRLGEAMTQYIDKDEGGQSGAPKFPMPNALEFLMKYQHQTNDSKAFDALKLTLDKMMYGGIYDQLGGGFARYSVDRYWKVPHFEKMMYDNGQLVSLYAQAYKLTKDPEYLRIVKESIEWVDREMTSAEGGFYSSLDADSEGVEGKFYVWTYDEIHEILGDENDAKVFCSYYNVKEDGNWEHGNNILLRKLTDKESANDLGMTESELADIISRSKKALMDVRDTRVRPGLDDKVLTSWNALMLKGYIDAYSATQESSYLSAALKNAEFILKNQKQSDHRLNRNYKNGKSSINAFLDDYGLTIDAFVALYQVTFDEKWLNEAKHLADYSIEHFFNQQNSMFNFTSDIDPPLVARKSQINDNVIPGSNSIMAKNLKNLGELLYNEEYLKISKQMLTNLHPTLTKVDRPSFYSNWVQLFLEMAYPPYEVAILGEDADARRAEMMASYLPNAMFLGGKSEGNLQLLKDKLQEGTTMIYVCQAKSCKFPVEAAAEALKLID